MAKQSKKPADLNRLAAAIVGEATDNEIDSDSGRGAAGGKARAAALSSEKRTEIARKAAQTRWKDRH